MNIRAISALKNLPHNRLDLIKSSAGFRGQAPTRVSRRAFSRNVAGSLALGATLGSTLWKPAMAAPKGAFTPVPIPGGSPVLGGAFHVFGPAAIDPIDAEPATITNMNGFVGLAYVSGMVTQTNTKTNQKDRFPFVDSDMRFMQGNFRGADGRIHQATFAFI